VNSEVFDHTSLIKFIETRFADGHPDLIETNITPWRRAVVGDLTSAFDFEKPNEWHMIQLPDTSSYKPKNLVFYPDETIVPPASQHLPAQEHGIRPARALPYALHARGVLQSADGSFRIGFGNTGCATAVFQVRSGNPAHDPRTYTVEPGKQLSGVWSIAGIGATDYDLSVYGPNGFLRAFKGSVSSGSARLDVQTVYDERTNHITLIVTNRGSHGVTVDVLDTYSDRTRSEHLGAGASASLHWPLERVDGWYDFVISVEHDSDFACHIAGHLETGKDSISDPAMGGLV
jgi:phospholipase C